MRTQRRSAESSLNGRQIVAQPISFLSSSFEFGTEDRVWDTPTNTGGSVTHDSDASAVNIECGTASGNEIVRQSRRFIRYVPGFSLEYTGAVRFPEQEAGKEIRVGPGDQDNGFFLEQRGNEMNIVRRTSASGSLNEDRVPESEWQSLSPVGITPFNTKDINFQNVNMFTWKILWYGGGALELGVTIGATYHVLTRIEGSNQRTEPLMGPPSVPLRFELENTSALSTQNQVVKHGAKVEQIGNRTVNEDPFSTDLDGNFLNVTGFTPILALQLKSTFKGRENRVSVRPDSIRPMADQNAVFRILRGSTVDAVFSDVHTESAVEVSKGGDITSATGGRIQQSVPVAGGQGPAAGTGEEERTARVPITLDGNGNIDEESNIVIEASGVEPEGNAATSTGVYCSFHWGELR